MMKIKFLFTSCVVSLFFQICSVHAFLLDEKELDAFDQNCKIHYLTHKETNGWHIQTDTTYCPNGWLQGYANVTVMDAFNRPVEQLFGYFSRGYWTGKTQLNPVEIKRSSEEYGVQKATFEIGRDVTSDITYIGQMTTRKDGENGNYGPFEVCAPFRILAVTPHKALFRNPHATQVILDDAVKQTRMICTGEKRILFFASTVPEPKQEDIFFYADINLESGKTYIKRNRTSAEDPRANDAREPLLDEKKNNSDSAPVLNEKGVVHDTEGQLEALSEKEKAGVTLTSVEDETEKSDSDKTIKRKTETAVEQESSAKNETPDSFSQNEAKFVRTAFNSLEVSKGMSSDSAYDEVPQSNYISDGSQVIFEQQPEHREPAQMNLDALPHLKLACDVLMQPVFGTLIVHVDRVFPSGAEIDQPVKLSLKGERLSPGWGLISGYFWFNPDQDEKDAGVCQVTSFLPCFSENCLDIQ